MSSPVESIGICLAVVQIIGNEMSLVVRKQIFGVSDQVPHKPGCTATEDLERRGIVLCRKNKGADQLRGKLICIFVFAYANSWFSHNPAQMIFIFQGLLLATEYE